MGFNSAFKGWNAELNPIYHLLSLLGAHLILHISKMRVKEYFNTLNAQLEPICHLLALLGAHPILHINKIGVKRHCNRWNAQLHPIYQFLVVLRAHNNLHVCRIRVNSAFKVLAKIGKRICELCAISARDSGPIASHFVLGLGNSTPQKGHRSSTEGRPTVYICCEVKGKR